MFDDLFDGISETLGGSVSDTNDWNTEKEQDLWGTGQAPDMWGTGQIPTWWESAR